MDDYSELEQWEWLKGQIREYGLWVVGGILLGGILVWGWFAWQAHTDSVDRAASQKYEEMRMAFARGDRAQAELTLGELERNYPSSPYVDQGRLALARVYVDSGELDKAARELKSVAEGSRDHDLALIARLRLARVQIAEKQPDAALATLQIKDAGAFEPRYHEVRGDAYYAKGDKVSALREYRMARVTDPERVNDQTLLDLKISDLVADTAAPAPSPIKAQPMPHPAK